MDLHSDFTTDEDNNTTVLHWQCNLKQNIVKFCLNINGHGFIYIQCLI